MSSPLIFIHGLFGSEKDWAQIIAGLENFKPSALTLPGHGVSPQKIDKYSIDQMANWVSEQTSEPCHWVGYSLGGRVLLSLFEKNPLLFKSLTLISTSPGINEVGARQSRLSQDGQWCDILRHGNARNFFARWYDQELFSSLKKRPDLMQKLMDDRERDWNPDFESVLRETSPGKNKSMWPLLKNIPEALWIMGKDDPKYVAIGQSVIAENPKMELKYVEKAGHAVHLENPAELIKLLKERLRSHL